MKTVTALSLACLMITTACGSGNGSSGTSTGNFAGNWQITLQRDQTDTLKTESGFLVQSGDVLTGSFLLTGDTNCAGIGSAQGQVSGSNVAISVSQIGQTLDFTGSLGSSEGSASGSYSILASPCGSTQVGTWTASQVQPLTGTLQVTFTSTGTSGVYQAAGKVTQAPNTGGSATKLSGSLTSTDAPCFNVASISGLISGTSVVFNLLSSEGVALGQLHGTTTAAATTITGLYDFLNTQPPPLNGCQDSGTAVVVVKG